MMGYRGKVSAATVAVMLVAGVNLLLWNVFTPVFEAADESGYYQQVYYLAHERRLPNLNQPPDQAGVMSYPPTYYLPLIPILLAVDAPSIYAPESIQVRADRRFGLRHSSFNIFKHSPSELSWRWNRQTWAVHLMRGVAMVWGLGTLWCVYQASLLLFKSRPLALLTVGWVGFNPMFAHLHSSLNVINLLIFLSSLSWYWLLKWHQSNQWWRWLGLGMIIGLAAATKATGLALLPLVVGGSYWLARPPLKPWLKRFFYLGLGFVLVSGWWFGRNLRLYGSLLASDKIVATTGTRAEMRQTLGEINYWWGLVTSQLTTFWTGYGWSTVYFSPLLVGLLWLSMIGAGWGWWCGRRPSQTMKPVIIFLGAGVGWWGLVLVLAHSHFPTFHAKDLFPVIVPISLLTVGGAHRLLRPRINLAKLKPLTLTLLAGVAAAVNIGYLLVRVSPKLAGTTPLF